MEAVQTTPIKEKEGLFKSLFTPIAGQTATTGKPVESAPNASPGTTTGTPGPATSASGTVTEDQVFSALKHTEISSVSGSGIPGQPAPGPGAGNSSVSLGGMVQGEWAVNIMDAILPAAMVAGFYAFGVKLRKTELQLTQSEKNTLAPIMQKCLDTVLLNFSNPWNALIVTLGAIYGGKAMEKGLLSWIDKSQEKKEQEALADKIKAAEQATNPAVYDPSNQSLADIASGKVALPGEQFSEEEIREVMKKSKLNREKAIKKLQKMRGIAA